MNLTEIDDALSAAINALGVAQATLRKSSPGRSLDVLRKADGMTGEQRASVDDLIAKVAALKDDDARQRTTLADAQTLLDSITARLDALDTTKRLDAFSAEMAELRAARLQ